MTGHDQYQQEQPRTGVYLRVISPAFSGSFCRAQQRDSSWLSTIAIQSSTITDVTKYEIENKENMINANYKRVTLLILFYLHRFIILTYLKLIGTLIKLRSC